MEKFFTDDVKSKISLFVWKSIAIFSSIGLMGAIGFIEMTGHHF